MGLNFDVFPGFQKIPCYAQYSVKHCRYIHYVHIMTSKLSQRQIVLIKKIHADTTLAIYQREKNQVLRNRQNIADYFSVSITTIRQLQLK